MTTMMTDLQINHGATRCAPFQRCAAAALLAAAALGGLPAQAHVTIAHPKAVAGTYVKVVLQVPHGCSGTATRAITVTVPPELLVARPMVKPGWSLVTETAPLPQPVELHGRTVSESTSLVRWEGGRLPNEFFDEFVVYGRLADTARGPVALKTLQTCDKAEVDWSGDTGSSSPAPTLVVEEAPAAGAVKGPHAH